MRNDFVISSAGMLTSLSDIKNGCAAARAGITRGKELTEFGAYDKEIGEMEATIGHPAPNKYAYGYRGLAKLVRLGSSAFKDMLNQSDDGELNLSKVGIIINLSSEYFGNRAVIEELAVADMPVSDPDNYLDEDVIQRRSLFTDKLLIRILQLNNISSQPVVNEIIFEDAAGMVTAIKKATNLIECGKVEKCIIGGIDSLINENYLSILNDFQYLRTPSNINGIAPGEAAAFVIIEKKESVIKRKKTVWATVEASSTSQEKQHELSDGNPDGNALAETILKTIDLLDDNGDNTGLVIGNCNGRNNIAYEWGMSKIKLPRTVNGANEWHPALYFGETGAASGFLALCLACQGLKRGYAGTNNVLIWQASPTGLRGSLYLRNGNITFEATEQ